MTKPPDNLPLNFAVRRLYTRGTRLHMRVVTRTAPVIGDLSLSALRYADRRPMYVLELLDARNGIRPRLIPSLQDPSLLTLGALGMLIRGTELIDEKGQVSEYVQEWHVQFVLQPEANNQALPWPTTQP